MVEEKLSSGGGKEVEEIIPTGSLEPFPGSKKVVSKSSVAEQYVPKDATKYYDYFTKKLEIIS